MVDFVNNWSQYGHNLFNFEILFPIKTTVADLLELTRFIMQVTPMLEENTYVEHRKLSLTVRNLRMEDLFIFLGHSHRFCWNYNLGEKERRELTRIRYSLLNRSRSWKRNLWNKSCLRVEASLDYIRESNLSVNEDFMGGCWFY